MVGFLGALIPAAVGAIGSLFGGSKTKTVDNNRFGMSEGQRGGLAGMAYDQFGRIYGGDPNRFWGRDTMGGFTEGQLGRMLMTGQGPGGGGGYGSGRGWGGGGYSAQGYGAQGYDAAQAAAERGQYFGADASLIDMTDPIYSMQVPEWLRQNVHGAMTRTMNAQSEDDVRLMMDAARRGGYARGPATDYMAAEARRRALANTAEGIQGFETNYALSSADRRAGALGQNAGLQTQVNVGNAQRQTDVSMGNAQLGTQVSMYNTGQTNDSRRFGAAAANEAAQFGAASRNQAAQFNAAARNQAAAHAAAAANQAAMARGDAARFLLGYGRQGEAMDLDRYKLLHGMNLDWQTPQYQVGSYQEPNAFSKIASGFGAGMNLFGAVQDRGGWMNFLRGGPSPARGGGSFTPPAPFSGGGMFPAPNTDWLYGQGF